MATKPIPDGYASVTPYLIVKGAAKALEFYQKAFDATEVLRLDGPNGTIGHAEFRIGNSTLMMADEHPEMGAVGPSPGNKPSVSFYIYVDDVDALFAQAVAAGATVVRPLANQFYGDRNGTVADPFGHLWSLGSRVEEVAPDELHRRMGALKDKPQ